MAACWHIDADGKIILARTTYQFPTGDFEKAIKGLQERLLEETGAIPTLPGPLPTVQIHQGDDDAKVIDVGIDHPVEESRAPCNGEGGGCAGESIDDNAKVPAGAK